MNEEKINEQLNASDEDTLEGKYLTFPLGDAKYGIEIKDISEVIRIQPITHVPNVSFYTKGLINLRGKVIPIVDLRMRFGLPELETSNRTCIVIVLVDGITTGLIVDTVSEVIQIPKDKIDPSVRSNQSSQKKFVSHIGKTDNEVFLLLDVKLIVCEDIDI